MKVIGIIPARYASTRFPGKPLELILGKPMIVRVYERALEANCWDKLVVATDNKKIKEVIEDIGGIALMTSHDNPTGTDRIAEACDILDLDSEDLVVNIQGDEPLLPYIAISELVKIFKGTPIRASIGTLAFRSTNKDEFLDPNVVKVVTSIDNYALYFSRSPIPFDRDQDSRKVSFLKHLGFYIYRVKFLHLFRHLPSGHLERIEKLEQLRALENGYSIKVIISKEDSWGVDTPEDLTKVEEYLQNEHS